MGEIKRDTQTCGWAGLEVLLASPGMRPHKAINNKKNMNKTKATN